MSTTSETLHKVFIVFTVRRQYFTQNIISETAKWILTTLKRNGPFNLYCGLKELEHRILG